MIAKMLLKRVLPSVIALALLVLAGMWLYGFVGGCTGNTQGVARLVVGRKVKDVIAMLKGIQCRNGTSCPDQLAQALESEESPR